MSVRSHSDNLQILFEDNHLIIINKRAGDLVQGDKTGDIPLPEYIKEYLVKKYNKPGAAFLGVVHRLDRPTSGIVVFAKTSKALSRLNEQFSTRQTQKIYWAVVQGAPEIKEATLIHYLVRNPKNNTSKAHIKEVSNSKLASLHYKTLKALDRYSLLEVELHTGRHHQIRSQLKTINCPIKGDLKYGAERSNPDGGIHLHARKLIFTHPVSKEIIDITADLPQDSLWNMVK